MSVAARVILGALEGTRLSTEEQRFLKRVPLAGVTLFSRNVPKDHAQLTHLCEGLQVLSSCDEPRIIAIDQEGGRVRRIKGEFPDPGPALELAAGRVDSESLNIVEEESFKVHSQLEKLGINLHLAPVCDLLTEPSNSAIGNRAFGLRVEQAIPRIDRFLKGMARTSVQGCLKHFPGQGDAREDTHDGVSLVVRTEKEMRTREMLSFVPFLHRAPMVMVSHCTYPYFDAKPASLSSKIIHDRLRVELGFRGVIVSDDMMMSAIPQDQPSWREALIEAMMAGVDLLMICAPIERIHQAMDALESESRRSPAFADRMIDAAVHVDRFRSTLPRRRP